MLHLQEEGSPFTFVRRSCRLEESNVLRALGIGVRVGVGGCLGGGARSSEGLNGAQADNGQYCEVVHCCCSRCSSSSASWLF
jgi:hypothetical protein